MKKICAPHISTTLQAAATNIKQPLQKNEPKTRKNTTKTSLWNTVLHRIFCCCCCHVCRFLSLSNASFTAREEKRLQWQCKWKNKILCQKKQQLRFIHNHNKNEVFFASSFYIYIYLLVRITHLQHTFVFVYVLKITILQFTKNHAVVQINMQSPNLFNVSLYNLENSLMCLCEFNASDTHKFNEFNDRFSFLNTL